MYLFARLVKMSRQVDRGIASWFELSINNGWEPPIKEMS